MIFPLHQCACGKRRMQDMVSDRPIRMRIRLDSRNDCVSHWSKCANTCGVVSRKEIVKSEAACIPLITCFFVLFLDDLNEISDDRERLRSFTQIKENVGVDPRIKVIWLAFSESIQIVKLPQIHNLA